VSVDAPAIDVSARPRIGRHFRLQWEEVQQAWVLLYPEGMVKLNGSAGEILKRCNGERSVEEIIAELEHAFQTPGLAADVTAFFAIARRQQWIVLEA
jgi:pyrroloquinoline quinone biosynthesis protein D